MSLKLKRPANDEKESDSSPAMKKNHESNLPIKEISKSKGKQDPKPQAKGMKIKVSRPEHSRKLRGVGSLVVYTSDSHADGRSSIPGCGLCVNTRTISLLRCRS